MIFLRIFVPRHAAELAWALLQEQKPRIPLDFRLSVFCSDVVIFSE